MEIYSKAFTAKSSADRGAKRAGLDANDYTVIKNDADGKWYVVPVKPEPVIGVAVDFADDTLATGGEPSEPEAPLICAHPDDQTPHLPTMDAVQEHLTSPIRQQPFVPHPDQTSPMTVGPETFLDEPARASNNEAPLALPDAFPSKASKYATARAQAPTVSAVQSPVAVCKTFLASHPHLSRAEAIHALTKAGIAFGTASTQYSKWAAARRDTNGG